MSKINSCHACDALIQGVKSRIALTHTCGRTPKEIQEYIEENTVIFRHSNSGVFFNVSKHSLISANGEFIDKPKFAQGGIITNEEPMKFPLEDDNREYILPIKSERKHLFPGEDSQINFDH